VAQPNAWRTAPTKVFLLGGSAMWGVTARDSFDIPSFTAAALERLGVGPVEVVNLAQAAYNTTQELNTLALELAHGRAPTVAVFFDGYNDIATAWKYGEPGHTYGDEAIDQQIQLGNRGFWAEVAGLGRHSAALSRLGKALGLIQTPPPIRGGPGEICGPVAGYYRRIVTLAQEIASAEGFRVAYFLQPVHVSTKKRLTPWEERLPKQRSLAACTSSIDSAMADHRGSVFYPLIDIFDQDTATVFVDENAHITEDANRKVAERIAAVIAPWLGAPPKVSPSERGSTRPGRPSGSATP
jgi:lysophospholipase L1-like esterase